MRCLTRCSAVGPTVQHSREQTPPHSALSLYPFFSNRLFAAEALSVTGSAVGEPRAVASSQPVNKSLSAASVAAVVPQSVAGGAAAKGKSSSIKKPAATKPKASKHAESKEDDDDDEEIIPMKVPMSDSDGEEEAPTRSTKGQLSPSGAREKTFLSEVDLEQLKPLPNGQTEQTTRCC